MSRTDDKFAALRSQGFTGALSDMTLQWLQANGATSNQISDAWLEMLHLHGMEGQRNDMWFALLGGIGYEHLNHISDRDAAFWADGGLIGGEGPLLADWLIETNPGAPDFIGYSDPAYGDLDPRGDVRSLISLTTANNIRLSPDGLVVPGSTRTIEAFGLPPLSMVAQPTIWAAGSAPYNDAMIAALDTTVPVTIYPPVLPVPEPTNVYEASAGPDVTIDTGEPRIYAAPFRVRFLVYVVEQTSGDKNFIGSTNTWATTAESSNWLVRTNGNSQTPLIFITSGGAMTSLSAPAPLEIGAWSLIDAGWDGTTLHIGINNEAPATREVVYEPEASHGIYRIFNNLTDRCQLSTIAIQENGDNFRLGFPCAEGIGTVCADYSVNRLHGVISDEVIHQTRLEDLQGEYFHDFTTGDIGDWNHTRGSIATAPDADGIIQTYTGDEPAFYRDQGLQLEAASENILTNTDIASDYWNTGGVATEKNHHATIPAPDGTLTAVHVQNVLGNAWVVATVISAEGATHSIYARTVSGTGTSQLMLHNNFPQGLLNLTEQWQRFDAPRVADDEDGVSNFYAPDGRAGDLDELLVWAPQTENNPFTSSFVPTSGAPVTRNETQCQATFAELGAPLPTSGFVNDFCGQLTHVWAHDAAEAPGFVAIIELATDTLGNSVDIVISSVDDRLFLRKWAGGSNIGEIATPAGSIDYVKGESADVRFKVSSTEGMTIWVNGDRYNTSIRTEPVLEPLYICSLGQAPLRTGPANLIASTVRIVPTALSDAEIEGWS